jgi:hypothetical protein
MRLGVMPLPIDVVSLPVYAWERARGQPFDITSDEAGRPIRVDDVGRTLGAARAGALVFWWALLVYGWLIARALAGPWAGRTAVALLACEPLLLAHASLATTDTAVAACTLALGYHFSKGRNTPWGRRVGAPAVCFGAAVLSKASALVFGPLALIAVAAAERGTAGSAGSGADPAAGRIQPSSARRPSSRRRDGWQVVTIGLAIAFLYCGSDWKAQQDFVRWADVQGQGAAGSLLRAAAGGLTIFSNAGEGLVQQIKHNVRGHGVYLLGRTDDRAVWYYFPVALSMKLTAPLLAGAALALLAWRRQATNWPLVFALMALIASCGFRVQTGVRFLLPLVAALAVGLAVAAVRSIADVATVRLRAPAAAALSSAALLAALTSVGIWPHGLAYFNPLWGGVAAGHLRLSDSNHDWGQGLPELAAWQRRRGVDNLDVWYWGADPAIHTGQWRATPLHLPPHAGDGDDIAQRLRGRYLAVSATMLYGSVLTDAKPAPPVVDDMRRAAARARSALKSLSPVDRTTTFFIYDFSSPSIAAHSR